MMIYTYITLSIVSYLTGKILLYNNIRFTKSNNSSNGKINITSKESNDTNSIGEIKTTGTDIDNILPSTSRFNDGKHAKKKEIVIEKLVNFLNMFTFY